MTHEQALDIVTAARPWPRLRYLCSEDNPDPQSRAAYRELAIARASGVKPPRAYPPIVEQAASAFGAASRVLAAAATGEAVTVDQAEQTRRLTICQACDEYDAAANRCRKCGCLLGLKKRLATEHCPIAKW